MKVLVVMDESHGIISSYRANRYVEEAVVNQIETTDVAQIPLFNGRHELLDSAFLWQSGQKYRIPVHDVDMNEVEGVYERTDTRITVIEGSLFLKGKRPVIERTNCGLGEMTEYALNNNAKHVVVSLGGIGSFDVGTGVPQTLDAQLYDDEGRAINMRQGAGVIKYIYRMGISNLHPKMKTTKIQVMSDFSSQLYGKQSEVMQTYGAHQSNHNQAAEIDNLIWYLSKLFRSELKIAIGPIERSGTSGEIATILNGLYQAEILISHTLVDRLTHLENLVEQADLAISGEGPNEDDQLPETTTLRIVELRYRHRKAAIAIRTTAEKFDLFES